MEWNNSDSSGFDIHIVVFRVGWSIFYNFNPKHNPSILYFNVDMGHVYCLHSETINTWKTTSSWDIFYNIDQHRKCVVVNLVSAKKLWNVDAKRVAILLSSGFKLVIMNFWKYLIKRKIAKSKQCKNFVENITRHCQTPNWSFLLKVKIVEWYDLECCPFDIKPPLMGLVLPDGLTT